jgi:signal transduction histidine kinase
MDHSGREDRILSVAAYSVIAAVYTLSIVRLWKGNITSVLVVATLLFALFAGLEVVLLHSNLKQPWQLRAFFAGEGLLWLAIFLLVSGGDGFTPILLVVLMAQLFFAFDTREASVWAVGYVMLLAMLAFLTSSILDAFLTLFVYSGAFLFFAAVIVSFRREQRARARSENLLQQLEAAHAQLREYAARVEELAAVEERTRLAREIHDSLGHHLTLLSVQLQAAAKLVTWNPDRAATEIENARAVTAEALRDVRQSVSALRATAVEQLHLSERVPSLIQDFAETTGVVVNYHAQEWRELDFLSPAQALTLYRAVQEGLTNVQKHAHASRVDITLERADDRVRVRIADNGVGGQASDNSASGFGLIGLRERVELLGGSLTVRPRDGAGFELCLELPLRSEL